MTDHRKIILLIAVLTLITAVIVAYNPTPDPNPWSGQWP